MAEIISEAHSISLTIISRWVDQISVWCICSHLLLLAKGTGQEQDLSWLVWLSNLAASSCNVNSNFCLVWRSGWTRLRAIQSSLMVYNGPLTCLFSFKQRHVLDDGKYRRLLNWYTESLRHMVTDSYNQMTSLAGSGFKTEKDHMNT